MKIEETNNLNTFLMSILVMITNLNLKLHHILLLLLMIPT